MASSDTGDSDITEQVIEHRFLIDGNGRGDDQKLNGLLRSFLTFPGENDSTENNDAAMWRFNRQLKDLELATERTVESIRTTERDETVYYVDQMRTLQTVIAETEQQLSSSSALLAEASSYNIIFQEISKEQDRHLSNANIEKLEKELTILKRKRGLLVEKLDERKRSILVLSSSFQLLRDLDDSQNGSCSHFHESKPSGEQLRDNA